MMRKYQKKRTKRMPDWLITHGYSRHPLYDTWMNMIKRCYEEDNPAYKRYGGRGIKVCERWIKSPENFINDIGDKPSDEYTLDRKDNDKDYSPENCRWATREEQANNTRSTIFLEYNGQKKTMTEWGRITGFGRRTITTRYDRGWTVEQIIETPKRKHENGKYSK